MKGPILEWISVDKPLVPPLHRRNKCDRGFNHQRTGALLCPTGVDWNDPRQASAFYPLYTFVLMRLYSGLKNNFKAVSYTFEAINGLHFSIRHMIPMTRGMGF